MKCLSYLLCSWNPQSAALSALHSQPGCTIDQKHLVWCLALIGKRMMTRGCFANLPTDPCELEVPGDDQSTQYFSTNIHFSFSFSSTTISSRRIMRTSFLSLIPTLLFSSFVFADGHHQGLPRHSHTRNSLRNADVSLNTDVQLHKRTDNARLTAYDPETGNQ